MQLGIALNLNGLQSLAFFVIELFHAALLDLAFDSLLRIASPADQFAQRLFPEILILIYDQAIQKVPDSGRLRSSLVLKVFLNVSED
jgi:hypothetical protein